MLAVLKEAVGTLELGLDGAELAQAQTVLDQLAAKLSAAYGDFDAAGLWDVDGATSMTAWLRSFAGMSGGDAGRTLASARRLRGLPVTAAAAMDGSLSAGQVKAIVANVSLRTAAMFADHEAEVVPALVDLSVADTTRAMRRWAALAEAALDDGDPWPEPESSLQLSKTLGGRWVLDGDLDPLSGEVLDTALGLADAASALGAEGEAPIPVWQRRAERLVDICRFFLEHRDHPSGSRHRPHVNLIVRLEDLEAGQGGELADGVVLDGPTTASLVCDSVLHRVLMADPVVLDYGTATRTISPALFHALVVRDRHCRFPGCDRRAGWCDAHHVVHVEHGGATCPENTILLCRRHHTRLHRPGWSAVMAPGGELEVTAPDGRVFTSHPPEHGARPPPALFAA